MIAAALLPIAVDVAFVLLLLAIAGSFVRVVIGPSLPDRVIALDLLSVTLVAFAAVYALDTGERSFLDVSLALALRAFLTTVVFARDVERRGDSPPEGENGDQP